jgi:hypothetical protein
LLTAACHTLTLIAVLCSGIDPAGSWLTPQQNARRSHRSAARTHFLLAAYPAYGSDVRFLRSCKVLICFAVAFALRYYALENYKISG